MIKNTVVFLLLALFVSCKQPMETLVEDKIHSAWIYDFEGVSNEMLVNKIISSQLNTAFISISPAYLNSTGHLEYQNKVVDFLTLAESNQIKVYLLICEQPSYTLKENHYLALEEVYRVIQFFNNKPHVVFEGIQLDIEPHALDQWKDADDFNDGVREELLKQWLQLHRDVKDRLIGTGYSYSTVITWWYDSKFRDGVLPSGDTALLKDIVDFIAVMAFSDVKDAYKQAEDECNIMKTVVGYNKYIYTNSSELEEQKSKTANAFLTNPNYLGDVFFKLTDY